MSVDQKIISFGQFISGQNLGNRLSFTNKTDKEQTFSLTIDSQQDTFTETVEELFAPFDNKDLPIKSTSTCFKKRAVNSQKKFNCWSIENPMSRSLCKSFVLVLAPKEQKDIVVVVQTPMRASCSDMLAKLELTNIPAETDAQQSFVEKRLDSMSRG